MSDFDEQRTGETTAFDSNQDEVITHLGLEADVEEVVADIEGATFSDQCVMCGKAAVWFTAELRPDSASGHDARQVTRFWCGECVPEAFVKRWKKWSWTPDDELEEYSPPSLSDADRGDGGLLTQQNTADVVCHLDFERDVSDVTGVLNYAGLTRDEAMCCDCEAQADWYYAEVNDLFRVYDFDAARVNSFLCNDCIRPELIEMWCRRPWTPSEELDE
jgi:hypothetical protein